ncbi:serine hydrolase [Lichenihabitans sp. PAMC28606]|uniref:serine hydrolase n=1 Tax=Lichenihabitans sp. PAMC28606 TaxID=2880932 RepID=UPI001D0BE068|nr:serine hydrolase [Lichenihabitans sp. PAMC28606]UDL94776.1 serine hydrolase [Lichenihabitans sp. PAMC28606]
MASFRKLWPTAIAAYCLVVSTLVASASAPSLVVDVDSGQVLYQDAATAPWYPASLTKLMTVYVALSAVREGRITLDTPLMVSARAAVMPPSKMGFRPGTLVTLDNALKMLMVKSPNDVAVTIAEGVSGSVEAFADDMNVYGARLGLHESHFVNPNGLPDDRHMSSARDMAIIARALLHDFPEERGLFSIGVLAFGNQLINNHNGLLGRYPGVDGMKTGYTCAAGYNIVASADRNGRHLITVVMGAPSNGTRNEKVAALFDRFFAGAQANYGTLDSLPSSSANTPPNMRDTMCGRGRRAAIAEAEGEDLVPTPGAAPDQGVGSHLSPTRVAFEPVRVTIGPVAGWTGRIAQAVGSGAREMAAPVKTATTDAVGTSSGPSPVSGQTGTAGGAVEAAAPAPMALLGATPLAPAALAAKRFVHATPSLGLRVGGRRARKTKFATEEAKPKAQAVANASATETMPPERPKHKGEATRKTAVFTPKPAKPVKAVKATKPAAKQAHETAKKKTAAKH